MYLCVCIVFVFAVFVQLENVSFEFSNVQQFYGWAAVDGLAEWSSLIVRNRTFLAFLVAKNR
jgi:hypothetical protein